MSNLSMVNIDLSEQNEVQSLSNSCQMFWTKQLEKLKTYFSNIKLFRNKLWYIVSLSDGWKVVAPREIVHWNSGDKLNVHFYNSSIILSLDHQKCLAIAKFMTHATTHSHPHSASLSLYLSDLLTPHSFLFRIKDVSCFWEASLNKHISSNKVLI